ncbi:uncharacterized protein [Misgurnus anguillicaudatus]|uniref:uncharacterized protein isoform X1 n=1 Tax=Misgurnus anguillicaudatus TaxID=75329 RepID=UPI003CCF8480
MLQNSVKMPREKIPVFLFWSGNLLIDMVNKLKHGAELGSLEYLQASVCFQNSTLLSQSFKKTRFPGQRISSYEILLPICKTLPMICVLLNTHLMHQVHLLLDVQFHHPALQVEDPAGMKAHFKELTGIDINNSFEESASSKFRRILEYFQFQCTERASRAGRILTKYRAGWDHVCGAVMLLLTHFKNDQDHFLVMVEDTCVPSDICSEKLPATPCIVVCGENPLTASVYMAAVDQMIVNDHLLSFTEALYLMFSLYYILNISYPVELGATLEFLQR